MNSVLFGLASAVGLGTADFMARFSARRLGAPLTYGVVLLVGSLCSTIYLLVVRVHLVWSAFGCALAVAHGVSVALMCLMLYVALARGPVAVVAPIVAAHPVPVLAVNVMMGIHPTTIQWVAMAAILVGGMLVAFSATSHSEASETRREENWITILIAAGACLAYAALVLTGQRAVLYIGDVETMWIGRCSGLVLVAAILAFQRRPRLPAAWDWLPFVGAQGILDMLGYLAFLAGSNTANPHITMIVASGFSVVTVLLARVVIHESVSAIQWGAIALIAVGTAVLSTMT